MAQTCDNFRFYKVIRILQRTTGKPTPYYKVLQPHYAVLQSMVFRFTILHLTLYRFTLLPFYPRLGATTFYCFTGFPFYPGRLCLGNTVSRETPQTGFTHDMCNAISENKTWTSKARPWRENDRYDPKKLAHLQTSRTV